MSLNAGEKYMKSYHENILIVKEITIMCFLNIRTILRETGLSSLVFFKSHQNYVFDKRIILCFLLI